MTAQIAAPPAIALDPGLNAAVVRRVFQQSGRVHIPGILIPGCAQRIHDCLVRDTTWQLSICDETGSQDLAVSGFDRLSPELRVALASRIDRAATRGFAYRFSNFRIDGQVGGGGVPEHVLTEFHRFINSTAFLDFARNATGIADIAFADAQATLYRPGDFLNGHDDDVAGKNRRVAYVFNFTPSWRVEWGGLLAFPDTYGHLHEAFAPAFNALNLMRVPMAHTVTQVSTFAGGGRYSITGWLRAR